VYVCVCVCVCVNANLSFLFRPCLQMLIKAVGVFLDKHASLLRIKKGGYAEKKFYNAGPCSDFGSFTCHRHFL
jgi:hypothetical protein